MFTVIAAFLLPILWSASLATDDHKEKDDGSLWKCIWNKHSSTGCVNIKCLLFECAELLVKLFFFFLGIKQLFSYTTAHGYKALPVRYDALD